MMAVDLEHARVPWSVGDAMVAYACFLVGLLLVVAGWIGASGEARFEDQIGWTALGSSGVVVIGVGSLSWLLTGRRNVGEWQRRVLEKLAVDLADAGAGTEAVFDADEPGTEPGRPGWFVAADVMTRFHRAECPLVAGKSVRAALVGTHRRRGRTPCDVCRPLDDALEAARW